MSDLRVYLLGNPRFVLNDQDIQFQRRKAVALLAFLTVSSQPHSRDTLATLFWPEYDHTSARANLRREISRLGQVLGTQVLLVERDQIKINPYQPVWLDVSEFNSRIKQAQRHCPIRQQLCSVCTRTLIEAADLYNGSFMAGFGLPDSATYDEWQFYQSTDLQHGLAWTLDVLANSLAERGEYSQAIPYTRRWLALDNLNEAAHRALMVIYARSGERSAALRQYQDCIKILKDELGVEPETETVLLADEIRQGEYNQPRVSSKTLIEAEPGERAAAEIASINPPASTLPQPATPFIGREAELEKIHSLLENPDCRILTVLGQGGVGKTRLAIQAAQDAIALFPHRVAFIPMAALDPAESILPALISALGLVSISESDPAIDVLVNYLRSKHILLVLDSFEHLVGQADQIGEIIRRTEHVKILVTSRQRLNLQSEWVLDVEGLSYPAAQNRLELQANEQLVVEPAPFESYSSVRLFLMSAQRVQARFQPTGSERFSVARIAQLVEGVPLALELAAGWINVLSCGEIAEEIAASIDILETSSPDVPVRQRSLRAVFDHSWEMLSEREKELFPQLSVFRGGFSRKAVLDITGISLQQLGELVNKSLLSRKLDGRFELHELLRQYADEKLKATSEQYSEIHDRHCTYYCTLLKHKTGLLKSSQLPTALNEIEADYGNFRAAWYWAATNKISIRLDDAVESLTIFCLRRGRYEEGELACRIAVEHLQELDQEDDLPIKAYLLVMQGTFLHIQGNFTEAEQVYQRCLDTLGNRQLKSEHAIMARAMVAWRRGNLAHFAGDAAQANQFYTQGLALFQEAGDQFYASDVLLDMAIDLLEIHNEPLEANKYFEKSLAIKRSIGDKQMQARLLETLGIARIFVQGGIEAALSDLKESQEILRELTSPNNIANVYQNSIYILYAQGQYEDAIEMAEKSMAIYEELGERRNIIISLGMIAECFLCLGEYNRAKVCIHRVLELLSIYDELDIQVNMYRWVLGCIHLAMGQSLEAKSMLQTCVQVSRQRLGKHSLGRDLAVLSMAEVVLGEPAEAWKHALESLRLLLSYRHYHWYLYALSTLAVLMVERSEYERAVEIFSCVLASPLARHSQWFKGFYGRRIDPAAEKLGPELFQAAQRRGLRQDLWTLGNNLLEEFDRQ